MLSTPYVIVDQEKLENNIKKMQKWIDQCGQSLRPHIKTHRSAEIAKMQLAAGAKGITCAKLGEAEVMADAGIDDILIAYSLVGEDKMQRLGSLMKKAKVTVTCDNQLSAAQLDRLGRKIGKKIPVLAEVMTHIKRGGVAPDKLVDFVQYLNGLPGLRFKGLFAYSGLNPSQEPDHGLKAMSMEENVLLSDCKEKLEAAGIPVEIVSGGSTVVSKRADLMPVLTESRAGNYVYGDVHYAQLGAVRLDDCALSVKATVISTPEPGRATLDCGSKILSSDHNESGFGRIKEYPEAKIWKLNEEHGYVCYDPSVYNMRVGETVEVIPYHSCVVSNLVDRVFLFDKGEYLRPVTVDARGKSY